MKLKILGLLAMGLLSGPMTTNAATVVSAPDTFLWTFNVGPASTILFATRLDTSFSDPSAARGRWDFFDGANGTGNLEAFFEDDTFGLGFASFSFPSPMFSSSGILDGVFSARLTVTSGSVKLGPCVFKDDPDQRNCLAPVQTSVPEPGTLALLGLGLAGLGLSRRRKAA